MPNQSLLYTGRVLACSQLPPDDAHRPRTVRRPDLRDARCRRVPSARDQAVAGEVLHRSTTNWVAEDRRKLLAFARDLLNSDYAGHRLTFQLFAQSPPFAHLAAVYRNFDWDERGGDRQEGGRPVRSHRWQAVAESGGVGISPRGIPYCASGVGCRHQESAMIHTRIRPFNTRKTYPEQKLDNDLCQAVVARGTYVFLRGQVPAGPRHVGECRRRRSDRAGRTRSCRTSDS